MHTLLYSLRSKEPGEAPVLEVVGPAVKAAVAVCQEHLVDTQQGLQLNYNTGFKHVQLVVCLGSGDPANGKCWDNHDKAV